MNPASVFSMTQFAGHTSKCPLKKAFARNTGRLLFFVSGILVFAIPLGFLTGLSDPDLLTGYIANPTPSTDWLAATLSGILVAAPFSWVLVSRVLDPIAFFLVENALLMAGYFFLDETAWHFGPVGADILRCAPLLLMINAVGFTLLLAAMPLTYLIEKRRLVLLQPLRFIPACYDARFTWLLRISGLCVFAFLMLPMVCTGTFPLLTDEPAAARIIMMQSDFQRSFYSMGASLMPFVTAGLLVLCLRRPGRLIRFDGLLVLSIVLAQFISSNRAPIAMACFAFLALLTMERRFPRWLLFVFFAACMISFTGLSGLTGLLRDDRSRLSEGHPVKESLQAAFLNDNLIDIRDGAWVLSYWDFHPLLGITYLGGLTSMIPSGVFPQKKEWHLGLTGVRIVGWDPDTHFGLRISFFGEAFLNFGIAGVIILATILGIFLGTLLRALHQVAGKRPPCLHYNLKLIVLTEMCLPLGNTSDGPIFWSMGGFLFLQWLAVDLSLHGMVNPQGTRSNP